MFKLMLICDCRCYLVRENIFDSLRLPLIYLISHVIKYEKRSCSEREFLNYNLKHLKIEMFKFLCAIIKGTVKKA